MGIRIADLDFAGASDKPFEMQVKDASGAPMEFWLQILGEDSEKVQKFLLRKVNEDRRAMALSAKKGKGEFSPVENDVEFVIESCLVRTVGWRGAEESFSEDLARLLFKRNKHIRNQVLEESANAANFTRALPES